MLHITFMNRDKAIETIPSLIWSAPGYFDNNYEDEWFKDELGFIIKFGEPEDEMDAIIENDGTHVKTVRNYMESALDSL